MTGGYGYGYGFDGGHHHRGRVFDPYGGPGGRGSPYGFGYAPFGYGYGYGYGYDAVYGPGFSYYNGPAYGGPLINPPVFTYPPFGYASTFGYGTAYYPLGPDPLNNSLLQYQYNNDWAVLSAKAADLALKNEGDLAPGTAAVPVPSSPEAKLKSLRYQAQGDEAFRNQDYVRAAGLYRQAFTTAKDNGAAFFRTGYALVATGQLGSALEHFKRGLAVEPALAITGPTPTEVYGPDNNLAWNTHLGRVTRWVAEDVRDSNRVLLLGILLYYDGDSRAREFLTKAWQLSGGTETTVLPLLNPPKVEGVQVKESEEATSIPADDDGAPPSGQTPATGDNSDEPPSLPEIPEPPQPETSAGRPQGQAPLFPLPSDAGADTDDAIPPLPAPTEADTATPAR